MRFIKIVVLGASGVGKSSIVQQFVQNKFPVSHERTAEGEIYTQRVQMENCAHELRIIDMPPLSSFPRCSLEEWSFGGKFSPRTATAYLLVYDASNMQTFQHVKMLKEQIFESRSMNNVPVIIVANKFDLCSPSTHRGSCPRSSSHSSHHHRQDSQKWREVCSIVRKQWKLTHFECSAKYNWKIVGLFKEVTRLCASNCPLDNGFSGKDSISYPPTTVHLQIKTSVDTDDSTRHQQCHIS